MAIFVCSIALCFACFLIFNICRTTSYLLSTGYLLRHISIINTSSHNSVPLTGEQGNRINKVGKAFNGDCNGRQEIICDDLDSSDELFRCNLPREHLRWKMENRWAIISEGMKMADLSVVNITKSLWKFILIVSGNLQPVAMVALESLDFNRTSLGLQSLKSLTRLCDIS